MDDSTEQVESDDAVIIVENEAESMPVQEKSAKPQNTPNLLDTCAVCSLNFNSREPKLLPCLHSFCKKCLPSPSRSLVLHDQTGTPQLQGDNASKPLNVIRCPVCRQECMEVDVMDNFFVKDSMEVPSSTVEKTSQQLCTSCEDNTEASGFCVECVEFLCVTCIEAHQRVKFTKDHIIRQKEEVSPDAMSVSSQKPVFCDIHKQEPLKLFCETCDRLTCRDCQLLKHKDHNYQFLEDAYKNHREHMVNMTLQLQEKKKAIEEVSNSINNGLLQVDENRKSVHNEIKKSICALILEINRKGKILVNQLEGLMKDHESGLRKQQEDVSSLSRHLNHVINFTKWATASSSGTALLYSKRLILFQIQNLLRARCNPSFVPQSMVRFQCRSGFWASNVDLGSLVVENVPARQQVGIQNFPYQLNQPLQRPGDPSIGGGGGGGGFPPGPPQQRMGSHSTLAQLQMQVEKLAHQPNRQPPPPSSHWAWYQNVRLQRPPPTRPIQGGSPSQSLSGPSQQVRRFMAPHPHPNPQSPNGTMQNPNGTMQNPNGTLQNLGFPPQTLRGLVSSSSIPPKPLDTFQNASRYSHNASLSSAASHNPQHSLQQLNLMESAYLNKRNEASASLSMLRPNFPQTLAPSVAERSALGRQNSPMSTASASEGRPGAVSWKAPETQGSGALTSGPPKRRRRSSPGPIIVIKDEPEDDDDVRFVQSSVRASLPDSTGDRAQTQTRAPSPRAEPTAESEPIQEDDPNEDWCAVCQNGGELLCCDKCPKVFHLTCHIPTLLGSPSGEWFCSFCRDLSSPEMEYDCDCGPESKAVKEEPNSEGFPPVDKRKCERLLLRIYCNELSTDFQEPVSSSVRETPPSHHALTNQVMPEYYEVIKTPMDLSMVKGKLESKQSAGYASLEEFVDDVRLIFRNCAEFNEAETEVAAAGKNLETYFEEQLKIMFPDRTIPEVKAEVVGPAFPPAPGEEEATPAKRPRMSSPESQDTPTPAEMPTEDTPTEDTPVGKESTEDTPTEDTPVGKESTEDTPAEDAPVGKESTEDKPTEDTPVEMESTEDKPTEDTPVEMESTEDKPTEDTPVEMESTEDTPAEDTPAGDTPPVDTPPKDTPPEDALAEDALAEDIPAGDMATEDTPPVATPPKDTPPEDTPPEDTPPEDASIEAVSVGDTTAVDAPAEDTSTEDKSTGDTPVGDTPSEDTPSVEDSKE
ncbi:transcription intermediary factor 1-alpha isoform X1 [Anguilla anguilla]|uniref:transcription intermediary factor 1-alpha isoform X1 n=1 Tax=Anguilla anguilla TaxID=7936 RepID=UPI0015AC4498|nr:transcription intermediary factor 1-alpha isoform X1 [Anguilla anguilla]